MRAWLREEVRDAERFAWETDQGRDPESTRDWPAFLSFHEARRVGEWRGMRIPTAREWMHVAAGRRGLAYPWGKDQSSVANTYETDLGHPTPVGTFENGRARPFGCYDMVGNVWEWVADAVPGYLDSPLDLQAISGSDPRVSVLGGSFNTTRRPTFGSMRVEGGTEILGFQARRKDPATLSPEIGVRFCADAEPYLWTKAPAWGSGEAARARVTRVGRRWAGDSMARAGLEALLADLLAREGAPTALAWLADGVRAGR